MKLKICNKKIIYMSVVIIFILLFCLWQNNSIVTTSINYSNSKIPSEFNGYTIVQISDLHNKEFGKNGKKLLDKIKETSPDIIVITGDLIDRRYINIDIAMEFVSGAVDIAPVYYVSGNHEAWSNSYDEIKQRLLWLDVKVLDDSSIKIVKDGEIITLIGLSDPAFLTSSYLDETDIAKLVENIQLISNDLSFKILLSHRPELFDIYIKNNIDLVFTGHAHGGQIRVPFIGGLVAPNQGLFPKYTTGQYVKNNTMMIVNRGLGNSLFPVRVFNRPEIIKVTINN